MNKAMYQTVIVSCLSTFALALGGCGGGGGGGSAVIVPPVVRTTTIKTESGISQVATYTASGTTAPSIDPAGASASITTYDDDGTILRIAITTPSSSVTWDATSGDIIDNTDVAVVATNAAGTNVGVVINATNPLVDWKYQTFGIWETGLDTGSGTIGAMSVGTPTSGSAIPKTGTATFSGVSGGIYRDGTTDYITASSLSANVDFLNRTIALATTATEKLEVGTVTSIADPDLDMTGTLTYATDTNAFSGSVTATGLTGSSTGQFYGPNAEELGGVFALTGAGKTYSGAYGAKQ